MRSLEPVGVSVVMVRAWVGAVARANGDVDAYLRDVGLDKEAFTDPFARIEMRAYDRVQELAVERTRDPALGLHVGEQVAAFTFGTVGHLVAECPTLRDAIQTFSSYYAVLTESLPPTLEESDDEVFLQHEFPRSSPVVNRVRAEFALAAYFGFGKAFVGRSDVAARSVWLEHDRPDYAGEYRRIFGVEATFGRAKTGFAFPRDLLAARRFDRDPKLFSVLRSEADFMLSSVQGESVVSRVRDLVSYAEGIERPTMAEVARRMSMSERSLRRVLATEGRTFRDIVDEAMKDRAHRLLRDPSLTIADVAVRTGYREVSAFHRAVRRWTSLTVRELQAELRKRS